LDPGHKKQQHNTELVGWFVACFFKSHTAQQRHWFGQLAISHIKQQVVCPCSHTIKHGSKVKTKRLSFVASFSVHFEPRFGPLGWLWAWADVDSDADHGFAFDGVGRPAH
jgi:hypothetical protein